MLKVLINVQKISIFLFISFSFSKTPPENQHWLQTRLSDRSSTSEITAKNAFLQIPNNAVYSLLSYCIVTATRTKTYLYMEIKKKILCENCVYFFLQKNETKKKKGSIWVSFSFLFNYIKMHYMKRRRTH